YHDSPAAAASTTSSDHHSKMASVVSCIVLLCLTSGLWMEADAKAEGNDCSETCPPGWTQLGSRCFIFKNQPMNWASAETDCLAHGGNLASIKSTTEYDFIRQLVRTAAGKDLEFWVGGHDAVMEGVWLWSDGFKFNFKSWGKGEPNNHGGKEHCMEINFGGTKKATGEVDGEESWRVFTPKRASSRGPAAGAVSWWLREQQTPPHPSEESSVSSPLSEEGSEELKDMLDSRGLRSQDCGPRTAVPGLRSQDCGPRTAVPGVRSPTLQLHTIAGSKPTSLLGQSGKHGSWYPSSDSWHKNRAGAERLSETD
ncbi:hypothetical protein NQZ68_030567, partial [Dissostichus eleginoides]